MISLGTEAAEPTPAEETAVAALGEAGEMRTAWMMPGAGEAEVPLTEQICEAECITRTEIDQPSRWAAGNPWLDLGVFGGAFALGIWLAMHS